MRYNHPSQSGRICKTAELVKWSSSEYGEEEGRGVEDMECKTATHLTMETKLPIRQSEDAAAYYEAMPEYCLLPLRASLFAAAKKETGKENNARARNIKSRRMRPWMGFCTGASRIVRERLEASTEQRWPSND